MTASNAWPNFYFQNGRKVDNQVAAPAETRTPNLHRAKQNRSSKSADGRVATGPARLRRMNEKQNLCRNNLTPTGLLMEGVYTQNPRWPGSMSVIEILRQQPDSFRVADQLAQNVKRT